jgi:hypothetical protein
MRREKLKKWRYVFDFQNDGGKFLAFLTLSIKQ